MKEINRFYIMGNKLPSDDGSIVSYKDHAAIVAAKDARIAALQEQVRALSAECKSVYAHALEEGYQFYPGGIEYTYAALREIRAQVLDDMADDCEADWLYTYIDELRSSAARIRSGEQP